MHASVAAAIPTKTGRKDKRNGRADRKAARMHSAVPSIETIPIVTTSALVAERAAEPLKRWKLSPVDIKARERYVDYGRARDLMFKATHTKYAPWYVVNFADQRRGRLNLIHHLLDHVPDTHVPDEAITLPPLPGKPAKERFRGPVKPIHERY